MANVDGALFYNAKSSGMILDAWRLTDEGHAKAFNVANSGMFPWVSVNAFKAISACYYREQSGSCGVNITEMDSATYMGACEASVPWKLANTGAVLFPDQFQPWEADDEAYIEEYQGQYNLTYFGEIAFKRYLKEAENLLERCITSVDMAA